MRKKAKMNPNPREQVVRTPQGYDTHGNNLYDNMDQIRNAFQGDKVVGELFIPYIGSEFLNYNGTDVYRLVYLASRGKALFDGVGKKNEAAMTIAAANLLVPGLTSECEKAPAVCQKMFRNYLIVFMCREGASGLYFSSDPRHYVDSLPLNATVPGTLDAWEVDGAMTTLINNQEITAMHMRDLMINLFELKTPRLEHIPSSIYICTFVCLGKRGIITDSKADALKQSLEAEGVLHLPLTKDLISFMHVRIGQSIDETNAQDKFSRWTAMITGFSLRGSLILQQTVNAGLTAYTAIKTAVITFPLFDWVAAYRLISSDFENYKVARHTVGTNEYYGFARDLGPVKSTNYKSLAYLCKELLIKYGGPDHVGLKGYQGWTKSPLSGATLVLAARRVTWPLLRDRTYKTAA